jgi:hypothetical protein
MKTQTITMTTAQFDALAIRLGFKVPRMPRMHRNREPKKRPGGFHLRAVQQTPPNTKD